MYYYLLYFYGYIVIINYISIYTIILCPAYYNFIDYPDDRFLFGLKSIHIHISLFEFCR